MVFDDDCFDWLNSRKVAEWMNCKVHDSWVDDQSVEAVVDVEWENYKDLKYIRSWMKELGWIFTDGMWIRERLYETEWYYGCNDDVIKYEKDGKDGKHFDGITDEWDKYFD